MKKAIEQLDGRKTNETRVLRLCETRWVERHDAVLSFKMLYEGILKCLVTCQGLSDAETSSKAQMLLRTITDSTFIVALCVLDNLLAYSLSLSLQKVNISCKLSHQFRHCSKFLSKSAQKPMKLSPKFGQLLRSWPVLLIASCKLLVWLADNVIDQTSPQPLLKSIIDDQ